MKNFSMSDFGAKLKSLRGKRSQAETAAFFNVGAVAYGNWERGDKQPSLVTLRDICIRFSVSSDWLLGLADAPKTYFSGVSECPEIYNAAETDCPKCAQKAVLIQKLTDSVEKLSGSIVDLTTTIAHKKTVARSVPKGIF